MDKFNYCFLKFRQNNRISLENWQNFGICLSSFVNNTYSEFALVYTKRFSSRRFNVFFLHYSLRTWSRPYWLRFPNASSTQRSRPHCCPGRSGCRRLGPFWRSKVYQCCPGSSGGGSLPAWGRSHSLWPCYGLRHSRRPNRRHLGLWFKQ